MSQIKQPPIVAAGVRVGLGPCGEDVAPPGLAAVSRLRIALQFGWRVCMITSLANPAFEASISLLHLVFGFGVFLLFGCCRSLGVCLLRLRMLNQRCLSALIGLNQTLDQPPR